MNTKLLELIEKYKDTNFLVWLPRSTKLSLHDLAKLEYSQQIGIFLEYLYTQYGIVIAISDTIKVQYLNEENKLLTETIVDKPLNDSVVINYLFGIGKAISSNFLPF